MRFALPTSDDFCTRVIRVPCSSRDAPDKLRLFNVHHVTFNSVMHIYS